MKKVLEAIKGILNAFRVVILKTAKAWIAGGVAVAITWAASQGIVIPEDTEIAVVIAITGVLTALFTWLVPNKQ